MKTFTIDIKRANEEKARIYQFLCDYHEPHEGDSLTPAGEPEAEIVAISGRPATDYEISHYGADECDCCRGDVAIGRRS